MKTFELKSLNKKPIIVGAIIVIILFLSAAIYYSDVFINNNGMERLLIFALPALLLPILLLRKIFTKTITIAISDNEVSIKGIDHRVISIPTNNLILMRYTNNHNQSILDLITNTEESTITLTCMNQTENINSLIAEICAKIEFSKNEMEERSIRWTEYINKTTVATDNNAGKKIQEMRQKVSEIKKKAIIGAVAVSAILMLILIAPFFINPKAFYDEKDGKLFYGNKEVTGVDPNKVDYMSYNVVKDSSHVFYKGEILEWADRATFRCLESPFYSDKNGLYVETSGLYSKHKIMPLEGDYDKKTFASLGYSSFFFKDKNKVYHFDYNLISNGDNPLIALDIQGLDAPSFENAGNLYWYRDKSHVYFGDFDKLRLCPEIDRGTFEVLSSTVAKDKNQVYYLTRNLKSQNTDSSKKADYSKLEGADAESFKMIDERTYEDKNKTWVIRQEGEDVQVRSNI